MLKFPPLFVQKIFCFVQIPKSFVQKHETKTTETEGNNSNVWKTSNNIQRKQQQCSKKTTAASKENIPKSLTDFVQKHETITAETGQHPEENFSKRADKSELACPQNKTIGQIK